MAVFESQYKADMSKEEAMKLVHDAIMSGINNDLGSGGAARSGRVEPCCNRIQRGELCGLTLRSGVLRRVCRHDGHHQGRVSLYG